ncbi:5-oxoprolinase [Desulfonema ishimotonii]|uniref:5-oxoprolinase n=1 Tax=Desulfonema ishimotonii TaxID=45657 RepID=A0A401FUL9_9BACT|nr:hydantoinase B/oxoprolinase family protein [Desulfonema ishimotonii]GBC60659.1 5-oxoprolinase [Desulfonema ishimotonii]
MKPSPILLEVFKNRFASVCEEMGVTLNRTAFSPNIKERRDFSCAIFDQDGEMIAQAAHIPVHLGSMPLSVQAAIAGHSFAEGDMVMLNDPFRGGTHLPDITMVAPVFTDSDAPAFYVANRAHHADVGGMTSGSMPLSRSLYQEGIIIPPLKIVEKGEIDRKLMRFLLSNVRTPAEREGDFAAQIMANITGVRRTEELVEKYDFETVRFYAGSLIDYSERMTRQAIAGIRDGVYLFEDVLDGDGLDRKDVKISVRIDIRGEEAVIDFSASDSQVGGSVNAVHAITLSAVIYVFRALVAADIPTNAGSFRPLTVITPEGSIVNARFPAPVAGGNVETSQRIADVVLGALAGALPERIPAASQGTMNNITIGGTDGEKPFAYYETIAGGMGASACGDGESGVHSHMTNTLNTPIEALEFSYPFQVTEYSIRRGSGGRGRFRGGDGVVREIRLMAAADVTVLSERRTHAPYGLNGGEPGAPGRNILIRNGAAEEMPGKFSERLKKGDIVRMETPGGGGYGRLK